MKRRLLGLVLFVASSRRLLLLGVLLGALLLGASESTAQQVT